MFPYTCEMVDAVRSTFDMPSRPALQISKREVTASSRQFCKTAQRFESLHPKVVAGVARITPAIGLPEVRGRCLPRVETGGWPPTYFLDLWWSLQSARMAPCS